MLSLCTLTIVFSLNGSVRAERFEGMPSIGWMLEASTVAADWVERHEGWQVERMECRG